jgi:hypothetical protein
MGRHPKNSAILMVLSSISMAGIELATASALSRNGARLMSRAAAAAAAATPLRLVYPHDPQQLSLAVIHIEIRSGGMLRHATPFISE